jgi:hypothetical protein
MPALDFDLGVDCSLPEGAAPYCEAPDTPPPSVVEPLGCPEPLVSAEIRPVGPTEPPVVKAEYVGGEGDNCAKELTLDFEIPVFNCANISTRSNASVSYGPPDVRILSGQDAEPYCMNLDLVMPCTDIRVDTKVNNGVREDGTVITQGDLRLTATRSQDDDICVINFGGEIDFPSLADMDIPLFECDDISTRANTSVGYGPPGMLIKSGQAAAPECMNFDLTMPCTDLRVATKVNTGRQVGDLRAELVHSGSDMCINDLNLEIDFPIVDAGVCAIMVGSSCVTYVPDVMPRIALTASPNPDRPCEICLDLDLQLPRITVGGGGGGGGSGIVISRNDSIRYNNNRTNTVNLSGASGGGNGSGSGGGVGTGVGDDKACTDVVFREWVRGAPSDATQSIRPGSDAQYPDRNSLYYLDPDYEYSGLTQQLEYTFNRTSVLEVNACRTVQDADCVVKWDYHGLIAGTTLRMHKRKLPVSQVPSNWTAGMEIPVEDRLAELDNLAPPHYPPAIATVDPMSPGLDPVIGTGVFIAPGVCRESIPYDVESSALNAKVVPTNAVKLTDFEPAVHSDNQIGLGAPLFRVVKMNLYGDRRFEPDKVDFPNVNKTLEEDAQGNLKLPGVKMTGGMYITMDTDALKAGRPVLDISSDMEVQMPHGPTGLFPYIEDFELNAETGKIYLRKKIMVMIDGVVAQVLDRTEYGTYKTQIDKYLKAVNSGQEYFIKPNEDTPIQNPRLGADAEHAFEFDHEIPASLCEEKEGDEGQDGGTGGGGGVGGGT